MDSPPSLSGEDKAAFADAVGVSTLFKVDVVSHLFQVITPSSAALVVMFLVLGVPWAVRDKEVGTLLAQIVSSNPRCKLVSWTKVPQSQINSTNSKQDLRKTPQTLPSISS
jgi:hypothetical protein